MAKKNEDQPHKKKGRISGHTTHAATHKAKCANYLTRSTCVACNKVFRSPAKRKLHVESGHKNEIGWNKNKARKSSLIL